MVQPTGGYLRETGSAGSYPTASSKNPNNDNFRETSAAPLNGVPSVRMSALRQAMASADVRLAIDSLSETADSFERRLEAELGKSSIAEDLTESDRRKIEQVNLELDKACREIAQEAQINLRIGQLMQERDREIRNVPERAAPQTTIAAQAREKPFKAASAARRIALLGVVAVALGGGWAAKDLPIADRVMEKVTGADTTPALAATMAGDEMRPSAGTVYAAGDPNPPRVAAALEDWRSGLGERMSPNTVEAATPEKTAGPGKAAAQANSLPAIRTNIRPQTGVAPVRIVRSETEASSSAAAEPPAEPKAPRPIVAPVARLAEPTGPVQTKAEETPPLPRSRQPEMVEVALSTARSLDTLSGEQRDLLKQKLVQGECLAKALGSVFEKVPILAMRDLVRQLEGAC